MICSKEKGDALSRKGPLPDDKKIELGKKLQHEIFPIINFAMSLMGGLLMENGISSGGAMVPWIALSDDMPSDQSPLTWGDIKNWSNEAKCAPKKTEARPPKDMDGIFHKASSGNHAGGDDDIACQKEMRRLGEYDSEQQMIIIYYRNHPSYARDDSANGNFGKGFLAELYGTLAHEWAHHLHCLYLGKAAFDTADDHRDFVIEPIADYFSYLYLKSNPNDPLYMEKSSAAGALRNFWREYYGSPLPYAYAITFEFENDPKLKFISAFCESKKGWIPAYDLIMDKVKNKPRINRIRASLAPIFDPDEEIWNDLQKRLPESKNDRFFFACEDRAWEKDYLFAPEDGAWHHEILKLVKKGNVILYLTKNSVCAVGKAQADCVHGKDPVSQKEGLFVEMKVKRYDPEVSTDCVRDAMTPHAKEAFSPFNEDGSVKAIYLGWIDVQDEDIGWVVPFFKNLNEAYRAQYRKDDTAK